MSALPTPKLTFEQYLDLEREAEFRSEFIKGEVFAMAGGSRGHAHIIAATLASLYNQLEGSPCSVVSSDMRVYSKAEDVASYPDVVVTCGPDQMHDKRRDTLLDATVLVEVLSPSTKRFDLGEKFAYYRSLPSFAEYLLLWQDSIRAEHQVRQPDGSWTLREFSGADAVIELKWIGCQLKLGPLYARVQFEAAT
jgi:Uma2 family endonuclease